LERIKILKPETTTLPLIFVIALLPGGATLTGMVPPLLWLVPPAADGMTGRPLVATKWHAGSDGKSAAEVATEQAGW
jgi:hypothetical protein